MCGLVLVVGLLALFAPGGFALCNSDAPLPLQYAGQVLSTGETCSSAQQDVAVNQVSSDVDQLINSILPHLQSTLSPSPCEGLGWTKVADIDMRNSSHNCPEGWVNITMEGKRLCRRSSSTGCSSAQFSTNGVEYSRVCGRVKGYQYGTTEAFEEYVIHSRGLNEHYVDGVVITRGSPREHVWTLAAGYDETRRDARVCPCVNGASTQVPPFVGQNYFCESGTIADIGRNMLYVTDPLWDGAGCGEESSCCSHSLYFSATLLQSTCDDLEVRICAENGASEEVPVELVELFVK